jgi:hypothetical protein
MVSAVMMFHVADDKDLLAAYGELSLRHEHLNYILRMTIKTLARLEVSEALDATAFDNSTRLRECIRRLARQRLGEGENPLKLQAILEQCKRATDRRNDLIHSVWGKELDGEPLRRGSDHAWRPLPTAAEPKTLGDELRTLSARLDDARLEGFLAQALAKHALPE